jgi:hypothetical protein
MIEMAAVEEIRAWAVVAIGNHDHKEAPGVYVADDLRGLKLRLDQTTPTRFPPLRPRRPRPRANRRPQRLRRCSARAGTSPKARRRTFRR